jgi:hypothetical protein
MDDEFAILEPAPERAVTRAGKGLRMKALLLKKWAGNYAGQVLTGVAKGSVPADVAQFYEDDEPTPCDVVKDPHVEGTPMTVTNDELDKEQVAEVSKAQAAKMTAAKKAVQAASAADAEEAATQRRAHEADAFAAKHQAPAKKDDDAKPQAGKEHGVK